MGLKKRLDEVSAFMKVKLLSPSNQEEFLVISTKDVTIRNINGREQFAVPILENLDAYEGYKVVEAKVYNGH